MEVTRVAPYPVPPNEEERLAALYALDILDTAAEPAFDRIANMAARLMDAPIALVSLVDRNRHWFKARCGLDATETSRDFSFCTHAMLRNEPTVVCDATRDARFALNPLVTGEMSIRFYVGAPLRTGEGLGLGSLCVIDTVAREQPPQEQLKNLEDLAYLVSQQIELRIAEKALRMNEARLKEAQRIAHVGHWEWDARTLSSKWSDETYRLHGLVPQSGITMERYQQLLPSEDRERVSGAIGHCLETGEPYALTHRIVRANGSVTHVEVRGRVELDGSGNAIKVVGTLLDVTARVQADGLLRQSNEELELRVTQRTELLRREAEEHELTQAIVAGQNNVLRKIAEGAPIDQIFDMLLRFAENQGGAAFNGTILLKTEDGKRLRWAATTTLPEEIRQAYPEIVIGLGGASSGEAAYLRKRVILTNKDGADRPALALFEKYMGARSFVSTPIFDKDHEVLGTVSFASKKEYPGDYELRVQEACASLAAVALLRDREQLALHEALRHAHVLTDLVPQIFFTSRADGWVDYYNEKWRSYTGRTTDETAGWSWGSVLHPDDLEHTVAAWAGALRSGAPYQIDIRLKRASDDMYRWHLARAVPFRNASGEIVKWFGTVTDIHQQKTENERLETLVEARTEQLRRLLTEKETLLQDLHHRVKNNLQVISSLLRMQGEKLSDAAAVAALKDSRQRVISMAMIHERLYGNQQMNAIDFGEYTRMLVNELFDSYGSMECNAVSRVEVSSPLLLKIHQAIPCGLILNELVTNALKYAYPKWYREGAGGEVVVALKESDSEVWLSVSDRGVGLPDGWDLASRQSLGLRIVDLLAKQLGGTLVARGVAAGVATGVARGEAPGEAGACFEVTFPRVRESA